MSYRFRLIDTAGSELGIVEYQVPKLEEDDTVLMPDGSPATVIEIYDDEHGREGGVEATVVVESD
jgi:hypothetical protein